MDVLCNNKKIPCGSLTWSETEEGLGMEFSFSMPFSFWDKQFSERLEVGDKIIIRDGEEVLRGIITEIPLDGDEYRGYDLAFYLNKSETIIQCKKISADKAIKKLLNKFSVPFGTIPKMATSINKLYKDIIVSDILKDILDQVKNETGISYRMEMSQGKLTIIKDKGIKIRPTYIDELGEEVSCTKASKISGTKSIEELRNKVIVAGNSEKAKQIKSIATDSKSISKYGLLSVVEVQENINESKAKNIAKNKLKELDKINVQFTCEMPGDVKIKPCRLIYFDRKEADIKGWYKVKSCTHTYNNGIYSVSCEMEG